MGQVTGLWGVAVFWGGEPDLDGSGIFDLLLSASAVVYSSREAAVRHVEAELAEAADNYLGEPEAEMDPAYGIFEVAPPPGEGHRLVWDGDTCTVAGCEDEAWPPTGVVGSVRVED